MSLFTLTLSCPQRLGIVHAVTHFLYEHSADIVEHQQFDDAVRNKLFLRTAFRVDEGCRLKDIQADFAPTAEDFQMAFSLRDERLPDDQIDNEFQRRWCASRLPNDPSHKLWYVNDVDHGAELEIDMRTWCHPLGGGGLLAGSIRESRVDQK